MLSFLIPVLVGTLTGIFSAFGIGGGSLLLIYLVNFTDFSQPMAQGINLLYFLPAALASLPSHRKNGYIETKILPFAIIGGLIFAFLAAMLSNTLPVETLRKSYGIFLLLIAIKELLPQKKEPKSKPKS